MSRPVATQAALAAIQERIWLLETKHDHPASDARDKELYRAEIRGMYTAKAIFESILEVAQ